MENIVEVGRLQLEYDLYEVGSVSSAGKVASILSFNLEEVDVARSYVSLEKKRNRRRKFISSKLGKYADRFGYYKPEVYDADDAELDKKSEYLDIYYDQLNDIRSEINEDNFQELYRFMSFTRKKNRDIRVLVEQRRECWKSGDVADSSEFPKTRGAMEELSEWFSETLPKASYVERVEKVKK